MTGIGHNRGPSLDEGTAWRRFCWQKARRDLLPTLPLEVLRLRVARAREIGLDYPTYANVRVSTGRDIVAFLFSSNALRLFGPNPQLPAARADRLAAIRHCGRIAVLHRPLDARVMDGMPLDGAFAAPVPGALWRDQRALLRGALAARRLPSEGVLLIGDTPQEQGWADAGALAGFLTADRFFIPATN